MSDTTIIYYTANREHPAFEAKVRETILANCGGLPIISVSHTPLDFGTNICIGDQPLAYSNVLRQTLIGLKAAKTTFCIATEDDCLYPPEYFQFTPPTTDNVYRYTNLVVYFEGKHKFWNKRYVEAAQMAGREFWIQRIERILASHDSWEPLPINPPYVFSTKDAYSWTGSAPVIYVKTRKSFHYKTGFSPGSITQLPYWGTVEEVKKKYEID